MKDAVLLVNLGTPDAPTAQAVSRYLDEFLSDSRVVSLPRWLWLPLLRRVVLPRRAPKVASKYASVWLPGGSPLEVHTRALADAVAQRMPGVPVRHAMRYGQPALAAALAQLRDEGCGRILVLPLYPQFSTTTTSSVADVVARAGGQGIRMLEDYHLDPGWVSAVAGSIRAHWQARGRGEHLLMSFHGLPQRVVDRGDPYANQCEASAHAIAAALELPADAWSLAYQSRFGAGKWLQPATIDRLDALAAGGVRKVDVVCPGFAADCLETLEEIGMMLAEHFAGKGGELRAIACLNDAPAHADAIAALAARDLAAW
ncbi:ferrochelatase [Luteimonas sp. 8-5]|uniref:ferrochelatase n=1 Tax=Luteimonas sp. 8-5 TaxID=3039387 RepID=UPI00243732A7|nr:ferrochelatase [Luteimonas sp. 8-5]MDG6348593.1 ferrochelatase [Luteimonas sp. 8-5]